MSNVITAYFKGRVGVAESLYQNDYGIVMAFEGIDLPAHFDCYFTVPGSDDAIPGVGADSRVVIPNAVLANSGNVAIHIPLHTGDSDSEVEYIVYFKVIGRARPVDDGTPVQMTAIEQALALLQTPIGNIEQIVNEALSFTGHTFAEMKQELQDDFDNYTETLDGDLATWKGGVESDFDVLQGQFDTAVAAVTTDTEVTDIRVGADGITDTTAGASVRRQFTDLKADLAQVRGISVSRIDGYYINYQANRVSNSSSVLLVIDVSEAQGQVLKVTSHFFDYSGYRLMASDGTTVVSSSYYHPAPATNPTLELYIPSTVYSVEVSCLKSAISEFNAEMFTFEKYSSDMAGKVNTSTFSELASFFEPINFFDKSKAHNGYFLNYNNGALEYRANSAFTCEKIPVKPNTKYTCTGVNYVVYFLDENDNFINPNYNSGASTIYPATFTTPNGCKYVTLSWKFASASEDSYMLVEGDTLPQDYAPYFAPYWQINGAELEEIYHVGATREYTSLMACFEALADNNKHKTIYVDAGQYDIFDEIGGSDFCQTITSGTNWKDVSVFVPNNTKVVGLGLVELIFHPSLADIGSIASQLLSPINVSENAEFENISIDSYNCRYAIHSDSASASGIKQVFKNVRLKHRYVDTGLVNGFGAGTRNKNVYVFENCVFDAFLPLSYHNNGSYSVDGTQIIFNNCVFKTTDSSTYPAIRFGNVNPNQVKIDVRMSNCYLNGDIRIVNETTGVERPNAFSVEALNCSSFTLDSRVATNIYTPIIYNLS